MFGYRIEEDFDLAKEQRRDRLWWWVVVPGICLVCALYIIHALPAAILQGYFLTSMSYGDSFYVQRKDKLGKPWLWKAILATIPLHLLLLLAIVWLDWAFPDFFPKVLVCGPILVATFGVEDVLFDKIVDRFSPPTLAKQLDARQV